jgi:hypothetical protein
MPHGRLFQYDGSSLSVVPDCESTYITDNLIKFIDENGIETFITLSKLSEILKFEYISKLQFLHESDLRNIKFWGIDFPNDFNTSDLLNFTDYLVSSYISDDIYVAYIGLVNDIDVGYGIFASTNISNGSFIGEYVGILEPSLTCTSYSLNYPCLDGMHQINAQICGNIIRLMNHSPNPNCTFQIVSHEGMLHVICVSQFNCCINIYMYFI